MQSVVIALLDVREAALAVDLIRSVESYVTLEAVLADNF